MVYLRLMLETLETNTSSQASNQSLLTPEARDDQLEQETYDNHTVTNYSETVGRP
jgi:hypothetical protein